MRLRHTLTALCIGLASPASAQEVLPTSPFPERLTGLCAAASAAADDLMFLRGLVAADEPAACLAHALLLKFGEDEAVGDFRTYFAIDRQVTAIVLPDVQINELVNSTLREFKGRHPAEQMARVYLKFRRTGFVAKRPDGSELSLEVMFRGSVFAAVTGGSKEETSRFAARAEGKE